MSFGLIIHAHCVTVVEMCGGGQKKRVVAELRIKQVVVGRQWWKWVHCIVVVSTCHLTVYNNLVEQKIYNYKTYLYGLKKGKGGENGGAGKNTGGDVENTVGGGWHNLVVMKIWAPD